MRYSDFLNLSDALEYLKEHGIDYSKKKYKYVAFVGSSCAVGGNSGAASYILFKDGKFVCEASKAFKPTTNNRMVLLAEISAMMKVPNGEKMIIFSPNKYGCYVFGYYDGTQNYKNRDLLDMYLKNKEDRDVTFEYMKRLTNDFGCVVASLMSRATMEGKPYCSILMSEFETYERNKHKLIY